MPEHVYALLVMRRRIYISDSIFRPSANNFGATHSRNWMQATHVYKDWAADNIGLVRDVMEARKMLSLGPIRGH